MNKPVLGALLASAVLVTACSQWKMMPPPVAHQVGGADPFESVASENRSTKIDVLYATDRAKTNSALPANLYGKERGLALTLGVATVQLGSEDSSWETLVEQSRTGARPPMKLEELNEFGRLWTTIPIRDEDFLESWESTSPQDEVRTATNLFVNEVNKRLSESDWKEVVILIPGVNTPFVSPVHMMAQFKHFMGRDGVFIAFSWPHKNVLGYGKQIVTSGISVRNLRQLILLLAEETTAQQINLIAYSAGAAIVSNALLQLRLMHSTDNVSELRESIPLGSVIYTGADEDHDYFRNLYLDGFQHLAENITIYTSTIDLALSLSKFFTTGSARLGNVANSLTANDLDALRETTSTWLVDVEGAKRAAGKGDLFAHSYWYGNSWVIQDVINLLNTNASPEERGLVSEDGGAMWLFPDNYPERATDAAKSNPD